MCGNAFYGIASCKMNIHNEKLFNYVKILKVCKKKTWGQLFWSLQKFEIGSCVRGGGASRACALSRCCGFTPVLSPSRHVSPDHQRWLCFRIFLFCIPWPLLDTLSFADCGLGKCSVLLTHGPVASILVGGGSYVHSECEKQHHWGTGRRPPALYWRDAISTSNKL